jgi:hypothetical protein
MIKNYVRVFFLLSELQTCIRYIILGDSKHETLVRRTFVINYYEPLLKNKH